MKQLIDMAAGRIPVDTLIINCTVVDVFNQRLIDGPLALGMGKVIGIGDYEAREIIDANGGIVMPGLIDSHVHIESSSITPPQFARIVLPHGTTTVIADPHEIANVCGLDGIRYMLDASRNLPLNVKIMLPSCVPATPFEEAGAKLMAEDLAELISHPDVLGVGEVMDFPAVINGDEAMLAKVKLAHDHGYIADGHSPGLKGLDLQAYAMAGIKTDHECSSIEAMLARIQMGMYIQIREGSACKDLLELVKGVNAANARRCLFCTDDREPKDIINGGHINKNLRLAVESGIDPIMAITIGTLNAAECYGLKKKGALAPGYDGDVVIIDDLESFNVNRVFCAGQEVARHGELLVAIEDYHCSSVMNTVKLAPLSVENFELPLTSDKARAIGVLPGGVLTKALTVDVKADDHGLFDACLNQGLNKLAVIERHKASGNMSLAILADYGLTGGAIATTVSHDSHNIVVVGDNDQDMLTAVKQVESIGGGFVLVQNGEVIGELPLPIAGLMSDQNAETVAKTMGELLSKARNTLGVNANIQPLMTLVFMSLPVIPELKLTSNGLFDVRSFSFTSTLIQ
ncbi:adenine deaminase [Endozoicomonas atrinae]|uniref:adenine deaminase n=1 Tax=Endozoicomonas atrinae TaxID=1333660 RepID=UPI0008255937|nr:adenine deaminase [Endozoicomonas atrinae]